MKTLAAAQADLINRLTVAGIRATADDRDVNPPCVFVPVPAVAFRFGWQWDATWSLALVVPDSGNRGVIADLGDLLLAVQTALDGELVDASPGIFPGVDGAPPLPALLARFTQRIE